MISNANELSETIEDQYRKLEVNTDEMEKLRLELTVLLTEKQMLRKELTRVEQLNVRLLRDNRE